VNTIKRLIVLIGGAGTTPTGSAISEILARDGSMILTRDGSRVIAR